ncbi:MAG: stage II sporulation protein M [Gammaproteobacteria bacterium]|nr:MAG: stage II sporulation protein M [Gammaproteobacteria bacterium]RKZ44310.1 MAG: stage II sporulation protein M [Gammaproteobacteria bacterium]RKZ75719.1 MAG: stage II sporulation protein M [Gammaproteobacteria bacterium]
MKQRTFERSHQLQWDNLECWLDNLDKRKRLENQEAVKFPQQYRQVCQHLALARDRHYTPNLIERLNRLVLRGHQHLYRTKSQLMTQIVHFILVDFPQRVREESRLVALSGLLFFGSLFIMFIGVQINPKLVYTLMNAEQVHQVEKMYSPTAEHLGRNREADSDFLMFGFYIRNNISIGFQTFAGGILFGLGTLFFIIFNGLYIGCVAGHLTYVGYNVPFYSFVAGHSSVELMAIVLAGAAGLKLGLALIAPGRLTRLQALHHAAIQSMQLVYGVIAMLLLAAFIEAFWSSNATIAPLIKYSVGGLLWFLMITYFIKVGHHHAT